MVRKIGRMNLAPPLTATPAPNRAPIICPTAMTPPTPNRTCPVMRNNASDARLLDRFIAFVYAVAAKRFQPMPTRQAMVQRLPVPGPKNPS